mgnify:FL=1
MNKELPWFKFTPSKWDNGNIQLCSFEQKGVFVEVCSMYWQRLGELPYKLAVQKICGGNATALDSLCDAEIIKVIDGMICIDFLNEQLSEFENVSVVNSENARLGWEKRRKNALAMRPHSERIATAMPVEKRREEKSREREEEIAPTKTFGKPPGNFITVKPKYIHDPICKIYGTQGLVEYMAENQTILNQPEYAEKFLRAFNGQVYNELTHVQNAYRKFITDSHK